MSGALWAAASGLGFGVFQSLNRRALLAMDVQIATFLQLVVAAVVLVVIAAAAGDASQLDDLPLGAAAYFVAGGLIHFFAGWTLLNMSQKRIGAARTSPLIATTPMFGAAVAFVTLGELPSTLAWAGISLVTVGAYGVGVARIGGGGRAGSWSDSVYGLGTAAAWSVSPVFIRKGLESIHSPLLGLTLGIVAAVFAFGATLPFRRAGTARAPLVWDALTFKLLAGVFVALSTWGRWVALDLTAVGIVLALGLMSVPVVLVLSPLLVGRHEEQVTIGVWLGALLVIGGSLLLVARTL
jgi:drug/metabolite transporter (DMT)-like permease